LSQIKARFGSTVEELAGVAIRYVLNHPNVASAIPGFRNEAQVRANLSGATRQLTPNDIAFIDEVFGNR
jgi:aryl-alcohol dehydrogenase-like predicted oxidoreductase